MEENKNDLSIADNVNDINDFILFSRLLLNEYKNDSEDWENLTLEKYLEGIESFIKYGLEGHYKFFGFEYDPKKPDWKMFARILYCAATYE